MTPEITVVMATYRQAKYLEEAIESVLYQEGVLSIVYVSQVSKDRDTNIVMGGLGVRFAGRIFKLHNDKPNLWNQRQRGLVASNFVDNISFFDSDDVMLPGWLEKGLKVAEEIKSRGKIPIVGPSYRMVDEKLFPIQDVILPEFSMDRMMEGSIIPDFSITKTENLRIAFEAGCKTAREQFTPQYSCYCSWLEMLKRYDCVVRLLPEIGFLYRQHHGSMHNRFKRSKKASRANVEMVRKISRHYFPELMGKG